MVSRIKANGIDVNYRLEGLKDGPVVMLSNSLMSNYTMWDDQIEALTSKFRVLRYDQRGHGGTQITPGPYSVELLAEDASALIEVLDLGPVHFVGLSMGGFTGQVLAVKYPEKISSLTLCDTACVMPPESVWNERIEMAGNEGLEALVDGTLERWFTPPFHQTGKEKIEKVRAMILATDV
ncbi:MAG: alpha/beta fold hydrolase, partial [Desulfobulbaceae bacterium]|nr:alpha/beta fold hydrolase [Desulfobulbaceae bacterium]